MDTSCSFIDLPLPLRSHGNFKITLQELRTETNRRWKHFSLANWHAVFVFMSFNFNTHNLLSETLSQSGSRESCLDTVEEGSRELYGATPFLSATDQESHLSVWKPFHLRGGVLWEGRWPLPCKVELLFPHSDLLNAFPPVFIRTLVWMIVVTAIVI